MIKSAPDGFTLSMVSGIIAGQVDMGVLSLPSAQSHIKSGAMPAICVSPAARIPAAPEISTAAAELALRPGALPGNGAQLWLDIQTKYDLWQAEAKLHDVLKGMRRLDQLAIS